MRFVIVMMMLALLLSGCGPQGSTTELRDGACWCGTKKVACNTRCE